MTTIVEPRQLEVLATTQGATGYAVCRPLMGTYWPVANAAMCIDVYPLTADGFQQALRAVAHTAVDATPRPVRVLAAGEEIATWH